MRDAGGERRHRAPGQIPVVAARGTPQLCRAEQKRIGAASARSRRLPHGQLSRTVPYLREPPLHQGLALEIASHVAGGALPGGREAERQASGTRRQVPSAQEVSVAANHLGWRAEDALLQGADAIAAAGVVLARSVSKSN